MAISFTQSTAVSSTTGTVDIPLGAGVSAGSLLTLIWHSGAGVGLTGTSTVTDSLGNTWQNVYRSTQSANSAQEMWYAIAPVGGTNTVSVQVSSLVTNLVIAGIQEWADDSGGTWSVASTSRSSGGSSVANPGSVSPAGSTLLCLTTLGVNSAYTVSVQPSGYTNLQLVTASSSRVSAWYKLITGSTTTENPTIQTDQSEGWVSGIGVFAAQSGGVTTPVRSRLGMRMGCGRM